MACKIKYCNSTSPSCINEVNNETCDDFELKFRLFFDLSST